MSTTTLLFVMALVTTAMTGPLITLCLGRARARAASSPSTPVAES